MGIDKMVHAPNPHGLNGEPKGIQTHVVYRG